MSYHQPGLCYICRMIVTYLAHTLQNLAQKLRRDWTSSVLNAVPDQPVCAWDDFSDPSAISVYQFPIHELRGAADLSPYVGAVRLDSPGAIVALAEKLDTLCNDLRASTDSGFENKWAILQMTSMQIDSLRELAAGYPPAPRIYAEPLAPYN